MAPTLISLAPFLFMSKSGCIKNDISLHFTPKYRYNEIRVPMNEHTQNIQNYFSVDQALEIILEAINETVSFELAVVLSLEENNTLRVRHAKGPLVSKELEHYRIDLKQRRDIYDILQQGKVQLLDDDPESGEVHLDTYHGVIDLPAGHSCLVAPLKVEDKTLGLLTLDHRACNMFTPEVVRTIETLSRMIAIALDQSLTADRLMNERDALVMERNTLLGQATQEMQGIIGNSPVWQDVLHKVQMVAPTDAPVLISGETGTGKERIARAIHALSARARQPFVAVNCSALTSNLAESELFGHEKGAFTGAISRRRGRFELANKGTLFLDEVGDLPLDIQPKLLRALQEQTFERVGGEISLRADVRIICATNVDLEQAVREGRFREDLYYRLNVFPLHLPPLRERDGDLLLLTDYFLRELEKKYTGKNFVLTEAAVEFLRTYSWPGNVRELQNTLERAAILAGNGVLLPEHLHPNHQTVRQTVASVSAEMLKPLDEVIKEHIVRVLEHTNGRIYGKKGAAKILGLKPTTLQSKMRKLGIR